MPKNNDTENNVDWSLSTWEGSRREALRRWAKLPLEEIIASLEEMQELNAMLSKPTLAKGSTVQEQKVNYDSKSDKPNTTNKPGSSDG